MHSAGTPQHDPDTSRALLRLDRIAEIGMDVLEDLSREAKAGDVDPIARVHAYDRLSRALRLTILLQLRLEHDGVAVARTSDVTRRGAAASRDPDEDAPETVERIDRERLDFEHGDGFERMTVDEALIAIQHGLGLAEPIDLTAQNDDEIVPDVAKVLARASMGRRAPPRSALSAAFDAQVRALKPKRPP